MCVCICACVCHHAWKIQYALPSEGSKDCQGLANQLGKNESHLSSGDILLNMASKGGPTHRGRLYSVSL